VVNVILRITPTHAATGVPAVEILQRLPYWIDGESYVIQLGDLYSGENRRFVINLDIPQIASLGLCKIAEVTIEYLDLAQRQEISVTMPVNVNVVPGDVAAGRIADPIVRAERLILEAQSAKALAVEEIRKGDSKGASTRLKNTSSRLLREASMIPVTDERSAESLKLIQAEAMEMENLANTAEIEDHRYSSKRVTESFSNSSRARKMRNQPPKPTDDPDESVN
jgi:Ca-activated chloride channel family protein